MKNTKTISMLLLAIISSFFFVNKVNAYFKSSDEAINTFSIAPIRNLIYEYYYIDDLDIENEAKSSESTNVFMGTQVNISDTLTNLDCENIKHYINGQLYNSSTYTVQIDSTIKEVCTLNKYNVVIKSYTVDKDGNRELVNTETDILNKDRVVDLTDGVDSNIDYDSIKYYIDDEEYTSASYTVDGDVEIEREYHLKEYTITRTYSYVDENDQEHTLQADTTGVYNKGDEISLNDNVISGVDYSEIKHYVDGNEYTGSTFEVTGDNVIKDVYHLNRYTITYNLGANNATLNNPINTYTSMTETFDLPEPTRNNYIFDGWCVGNNCSKPYTVTQGSTGNITVTASWHQRQNYRVTYAGDTNYYSHSPDGNNVTATEGEDFTTTITVSNNNNYSLESITITMGGNPLTEGTDFTYTGSGRTYTITIPDVSGAININIQIDTGGGGGDFPCIVEGTDVTLWDGSTKKIENITYNDLLRVWNHDLGTYGYEYAAWIERVGVADRYTKVTFSDGSELKVVGNHSIFSKTLNKYVDVNSDEFNVGDRVVNLSDGINYVTVTSIEHIQEEVRYYHVISERYFNLITNNILTTYEIYNNVSNFMGFDDNLKWQKTVEVRSDMYTYNDFLYLDKYLYKTFRLEETKYLIENGLVTPEQFNDLYTNYLMDNNKKVLPPTDYVGNRLWMVTTSDDINPSDPAHQVIEGSGYTIPTPRVEENFLYWYNHSDNKYYNPGDIIEVDSSMYLEAVYGEITPQGVEIPPSPEAPQEETVEESPVEETEEENTEVEVQEIEDKEKEE